MGWRYTEIVGKPIRIIFDRKIGGHIGACLEEVFKGSPVILLTILAAK